MVLNLVWLGFFLGGFLIALWQLLHGDLEAFSRLLTALFDAAKSGFEIAIGLTGMMALWLGLLRVGEKAGLIGVLARGVDPMFRHLFPGVPAGHPAQGAMTMNMSANMLGLDNAATPMGIQAAKRLKTPGSDAASDQLCRLVVLNTASIQLLPTNVAAVRAALGCGRPFDILPAVWVTSILSAGLGVCAAMLLGRVRKA